MTLDPDDLDIPMGGTMHIVALTLADAFGIDDPLPWFDRVVTNGVRDSDPLPDRLLSDLLDIDLETSTQYAHIREGMRLLLEETED